MYAMRICRIIKNLYDFFADGYGSVHLNVLRRMFNIAPWEKMNEFPLILGRDCAGTVVEVGAAVSSDWIGKEVYCAPGAHRPGTFAEYVVAAADSVGIRTDDRSIICVFRQVYYLTVFKELFLRFEKSNITLC